MKVFQKICSILSGIILLFLAVVAAIMVVPHLMGYQTMAVLSGSMEPEIPVGSVVYVKETDPQELEVGDIITYQLSSDTVVTHRIVEIDDSKQEIITKGDANNANDASPVVFSSVVGRADFHLPYIGYISIYAKTPIGIGVICGILVLILLLTFLPEILMPEEEKTANKKKRNKK